LENAKTLTELPVLIEKILSDYPTLESVRSEDEIHIRLKDDSKDLNTHNLVGTYTADGLSQGFISEEIIRDDCKAFLGKATG